MAIATPEEAEEFWKEVQRHLTEMPPSPKGVDRGATHIISKTTSPTRPGPRNMVNDRSDLIPLEGGTSVRRIRRPHPDRVESSTSNSSFPAASNHYSNHDHDNSYGNNNSYNPQYFQQNLRLDDQDGLATRSCLTWKFWSRKPNKKTSAATSRIKQSTTSSQDLEYNWEYFLDDNGSPVPSSPPHASRGSPSSQHFSTDDSSSLEYSGENRMHAMTAADSTNSSSDRTLTRDNRSSSFSVRTTSNPAFNIDDSNTPASPPLEKLLVLPRPQNRHPRNRSDQRSGLYDGEMEPEGVRGQEAIITPPLPVQRPFATATSANSSPDRSETSFGSIRSLSGSEPLRIRTFDKESPPHLTPTISSMSNSARNPDVENNTQLVIQPSTQQRHLHLASIAENPSSIATTNTEDSVRQDVDASQGTNSSSNNSSKEQPSVSAGLQFGPAHIRARGLSIAPSEADSTTSDDEVKFLVQQDFTTKPKALFEQHPQQQLKQKEQYEQTQQQAEQPSEVAAKAAAAAAQMSTSGSKGSVLGDNSHKLESVDDLNARAMQYVQDGKYDLALKDFEKVLHLHIQRHGKRHPLVASAYHNLGTVHAKRAGVLVEDSLQQQHCRQQALETFQAAARCARDALGTEHPNVAVSLVRVGFLLLQSRQYQNAIITFQEALRIRIAHFGVQHALVANLYNNLGVCHMHLGQFTQGYEYLQTALNIQRQLAPLPMKASAESIVQWLELADTLFNVGGLSLEWIRRQGPDTRRADQAETAFKEALEIRTELLDSKDPLVTQVQALLDMARALPRPQPLHQKRSRPHGSLQISRSRSSQSEEYLDPSAIRSAAKSKIRTFNTTDVPRTDPIVITPQMSERNASIFRPTPVTREATSTTINDIPRVSPPPPILEVSISQDQDDVPTTASSPTRIYMSPHLVPATSPRRSMNDSSDSLPAVMEEDESRFEPEFSMDGKNTTLNSSVVGQKYVYDAEESCMLSSIGIDSEQGKIHYPKPLETKSSHSEAMHNYSGHDIMVTQPFRSSTQDYKPPHIYSTGNKERDDVMMRARAILLQHQSHMTSEDSKDDFSISQSVSSEYHGNMTVDEGIAPLGGNWPTKHEFSHYTISELLNDPMQHVLHIHKEALRQMKRNNFPDSISLFQAVVDCQKRRHGPLHADVGSALHNVGIAQFRAQNYTEALKIFEEAARIRKGSLGRDHPQVASTLVKVGVTLLILHRFEEALWSFREALSVRKHALGVSHPSTARVYNNVGCVHVELGEHREARHALESALEIQRNALASDPENGSLAFGTATTLCNLGYLYKHRNMYKQATLVLREAADLQEQVLGKLHSTVLSTLDSLADSYALSGQAAEALKYYNIVLDRFGGKKHPLSNKVTFAEGMLLYKMSQVHQQRNDMAAQLGCLKKALQTVRKYNEGEWDLFEKQILQDIRLCREEIETNELKWI